LESTEKKLLVYFDRDKMEKIFSNLLSNALKFTPEGGSVTVEMGRVGEWETWREGDLERERKGERETAREGERRMARVFSSAHPISPSPLHPVTHSPTRDGRFVQISIKDTGIGIPPDRLPFIFDRFYQVDTSSTRQHEGTGIGLALAKELVELHRGTISVASVEGQGTTFTVQLPLGKTHLAPEEILEISEQFSVITDLSPVASDQQPATSNQQPATSNQTSFSWSKTTPRCGALCAMNWRRPIACSKPAMAKPVGRKHWRRFPIS
jgi:two-component sensor histidine kinase